MSQNIRDDLKEHTIESTVWQLDSLLDNKQVDEILAKIDALVVDFSSRKTKLAADMNHDELLNIILLSERIDNLFSKVNAYYSLKFAENTSDSFALAKLSYLNQVSIDISNRMLFFSLWFKDLDDRSASNFTESAKLAKYRYYLCEMRKFAPYTKSQDVEEALTLKSATGAGAFSDLYDIFTSSFRYDFDGKSGLSREEVASHFTSKDPRLREEAYKTILTKYKENGTLLSEMYSKIVLDWHNEGIKIRGYKSALSRRNLYNDVDDKAVSALISVVRKNAKIFAKYFQLKYQLNRRQGQNYPNSRYHIYAPYVADLPERYSYEDSKNMVLGAYTAFDSRFHEAAKMIFDARHLHSHPQPNKRSGAFCWGVSPDTLPYIMLNHTNTLKDLFTMMHEFGHGIHDILASKQPDLLYRTSLPMAETASTFGEMMLASQMLKGSANNAEKIAILVHLLDGQYGTIIRQIYFVLFEEIAHNRIKDGITKEELDAQYALLLKEQFGDMEVPEIFHHEWTYLPHIYHTPFYCYAYAWGNLLVLALYDMYKKKGRSFIDKYVELLSAGGSKSAREMLEPFGVNPDSEEFWQRGFDIIKEEIEELERLSR